MWSFSQKQYSECCCILKTCINRQEPKVFNIAVESTVEEIETPAEHVLCQPLKVTLQ